MADRGGFHVDTCTYDEPVGFGGAVKVVRWRWKLQDEEGTVLATSRRSYRFRCEAEAALQDVRRLVASVDIPVEGRCS